MWWKTGPPFLESADKWAHFLLLYINVGEEEEEEDRRRGEGEARFFILSYHFSFILSSTSF